MKCRFVILLLLVSIYSVNAVAESKWYSLGRTEEYVSDFVIQPSGVKEIIIKAKDKLNVTFRVDVSGEQEKTLMYGPFPIEMLDVGSRKSIKTFFGGLDLVPVNGEIRLIFNNSGKKDYRVLVVKLTK